MYGIPTTQILNWKTQKTLCVTDGILLELVAIETKPYRRDGVKRKHKNILGVGSQADIPELNKFQCGIFAMYSLAEAKQIAQMR